MAGLFIDEFEPDRIYHRALRKTVTEIDNMLFSVMTLNPQPLHIDFDFAAKSEWGKPLVNSLFTLGLMIGVSVNDTTLGTTIGNLGMTDVKIMLATRPDSGYLGTVEDADPEWRATAIYTRGEVEQLISDDRLTDDQNVWYALQALAGLRLGEAAPLRWKHYDSSLEPLGRLVIANSNLRRRTKSGVVR